MVALGWPARWSKKSKPAATVDAGLARLGHRKEANQMVLHHIGYASAENHKLAIQNELLSKKRQVAKL